MLRGYSHLVPDNYYHLVMMIRIHFYCPNIQRIKLLEQAGRDVCSHCTAILPFWESLTEPWPPELISWVVGSQLSYCYLSSSLPWDTGFCPPLQLPCLLPTISCASCQLPLGTHLLCLGSSVQDLPGFHYDKQTQTFTQDCRKTWDHGIIDMDLF